MSTAVQSVLHSENVLTMSKPSALATDVGSDMYDLQIQNHRLNVALNNLTQGVCFFDGSQRLVLANRRYAEIYGLPLECIRPGTTLKEIVERRVAVDAFPNMTAEEYLSWRSSIATFDEPSDTTVELKSGRIVSIHHRPMPDHGWVSTHEDITERHRVEEQIAHMARHDALTGLANRFMLREHIAQMSDHDACGGALAVICLDLDHFKHVNDTYGHQVGDALLCVAAKRLRSCVREDDFVVRCGGDEFTIVQTGADQPNRAIAVAERVVEVFRQPFQLGEHRVTVGASLGIAISSTHDSDPETMLMNGDIALYRAKADGRGTYRLFEPAMDLQARTRRALETDLGTALENAEFELFYQPKLNAQTKVVSGLEALIRWRHPKRGLVSPSEFIPLAEEIGLIVPIGEWVLRQACRQATQWPENITVAVNLSPVQFNTLHLVDTVRTALEASGLPANRLELEVTETALLQDTATTLETLHKLHDLGVRISLDDFGTGYSSISYLHRFPFDRIKIDQSFIRDLNTGTKSLAIVQAIVNLGHTLGICITAEGVETTEQFAMLREERCSEVQGYLFSMPVQAPDVPGLISRFGSTSKIAA